MTPVTAVTAVTAVSGDGDGGDVRPDGPRDLGEPTSPGFRHPAAATVPRRSPLAAITVPPPNRPSCSGPESCPHLCWTRCSTAPGFARWHTPVRPPPEPRYTPSRALADFIRCRDLTCRFPGCDTPATEADIDHTVPHPLGPTHASNLKILCRFHHLLKTFWTGKNGWHDRQLPDGTVIWTSPTGHTFTPHAPEVRSCSPRTLRPPTPTLWNGDPPTIDKGRRPAWRDDAPPPTHPRPRSRPQHRRRAQAQRRPGRRAQPAPTLLTDRSTDRSHNWTRKLPGWPSP